MKEYIEPIQKDELDKIKGGFTLYKAMTDLSIQGAVSVGVTVSGDCDCKCGCSEEESVQ